MTRAISDTTAPYRFVIRDSYGDDEFSEYLIQAHTLKAAWQLLEADCDRHGVPHLGLYALHQIQDRDGNKVSEEQASKIEEAYWD